MRCALQELNLIKNIGKKSSCQTSATLFSILFRILNTENMNHSVKTSNNKMLIRDNVKSCMIHSQQKNNALAKNSLHLFSSF